MVSQFEAIEIIKKRFNEIEDFKIYYTLRLMQLRHIRSFTLRLMKSAYAIHESGLTVTTELIAAVTGDRRSDVASGLHILGDKKALIFKRAERRYGILEWIVSPVFINYFNDPKYSLEE